MEILKSAIDWAKAEVFSAQFFILFGVMFVFASLGFFQLGKTEIARSYIMPTLVASIFLLAVGFGLYFTNKSRIKSFSNDYNKDTTTFIKSEIIRTEKSLNEYKNIVFKIIPIIILVAAFTFIFVDKPTWRAISSTTMAMLVVIILIDNNANARLKKYHNRLIQVQKHKNLTNTK